LLFDGKKRKYVETWGFHEDWQEETIPIVKFYPDGTRGPITGIRPRGCPWTLDPDGHLQVSRFPTHEIHRSEDWGWEIANGWVSYFSV
jgi:hypothetical protein